MSKRPKMGEILLRAGVIDKFQLEAALGEQARWGRPIGATLVKMGFIDEHDLVRAVATQLNLSVARLEGKTISPDVIAQVPPSVARGRTMLPLFVKRAGIRRTLYVGVGDPGDLEAFDDLAFRTGMDVKPVMVAPSELQRAIDHYYEPGEDDAAWALRMREHVAPAERSEPEPAPREKVAVTPGTQALADFWAARRDEADPVAENAAAPDEGERIVPVEVAPAAVEAPGDEAELTLEDLHSDEKLDPYGVKSRIIIHALCELLVEKGVLTRDELDARVRDMQLGHGTDASAD